MKIPYYQYPMLDLSDRKQKFSTDMARASIYNHLATSPFPEDQKYFGEHRKLLDYLSNQKTIPTYFFTSTIAKYLYKNAKPLMDKMLPFFSQLPNKEGCILLEKWTYFYRKINDNGKCVIVFFISDNKRGDYGTLVKKPNENGFWGSATTLSDKENDLQAAGAVITTVFLPFLEFAETETKIVNAKTRHKAKIGKEKYVTDIPYDIEIVDSNWFTTSIRTEGFGVSGHFRLQPVGQGRLGRKLTWIADFQKHGYTKRAKINITAQETIDK